MTKARTQNKFIKPSITEAKIRRIIRDELSREILIREGFMDAIKKPFTKLSEKAKKWVSEKVSEVIAKLKEAAGQLTKPEGLEDFWSKFQTVEGGMSREELASTVGIAKLADDLSKEKITAELDTAITSPANIKAESISFEKLKLDCILIEEEYHQSLSKTNSILTEAIVTTLLAGWWTVTKTVIGTAGIVITSLKIAAKIFKYFKKDEVAKKLEHYAHVLHELEIKFAKVFVYPAPVAYAAYVAASALKKGVAAATDKQAERLLKYNEFNSPEHKEQKKAAEKLVHVALLSVIVIEAITHLVHAVHEIMTHTAQAVKTVAHSGAEIGIEGSGVVKGAGTAAKAGTDIARVGRAAAVAGSQV